MSRQALGFTLGVLASAAAAAQTLPLSPEQIVNSYTTGRQEDPSVAIAPTGDAVIAWDDNTEDGSGDGVYARLYDVFGNAGPAFQVNTFTTGNQDYPDVATDDGGNFVVVWQSAGQDGDQTGIMGRLYAANGSPVTGEFPVNTWTTDYQKYPRVAMAPAGNFVVVWESYGADGFNSGIEGQRFDAFGNKVGGEFTVNTYTPLDQVYPRVSMDAAGDFVVVWAGAVDPGSTRPGVAARLYDFTGAPAGPQFLVASSTTADQTWPSVSMAAGGDFVIAWQGGSPTYGDQALFRLYAPPGVPTSPVLVAGRNRRGVAPVVSRNGSGDFMIAWSGYSASGDRVGVDARFFGANGAPRCAEFTANSYTTGDQVAPSVAFDDAGNAILAWTSPQDGGDIAGIVSRLAEPYAAQPIAVDAHAATGTSSNVNGVLESGETVAVETGWKNTFAFTLAFAGTASNLTGPAGPAYAIGDASADFGTLAPGAAANCHDATGNCYVMTVSGARPQQHWDAVFTQTIGAGFLAEDRLLHVGESFPDVPTSNAFYAYIENLFHNGVTGGCGGGNYCPSSSVTRGQMAVFLLKARWGSIFTPPPCAGLFGDVACPSQFADWIEELAAEGITGGCGGGNYCPGNPVTRAQMAVFLLKAEHGSSFVPPTCTGAFADVTCPSQFADWIEQLAAEQITGGCGGGNYCPNNPNTRGQMAVFLVKTFGLLLYGP